MKMMKFHRTWLFSNINLFGRIFRKPEIGWDGISDFVHNASRNNFKQILCRDLTLNLPKVLFRCDLFKPAGLHLFQTGSDWTVQYQSMYNDCVYKAVWTGFCLKIYFIFYVDFAFLAFIKCELYIPVQIQK